MLFILLVTVGTLTGGYYILKLSLILLGETKKFKESKEGETVD